MRVKKLELLRDSGFISEEQFTKLEPVISGKVISVFYELRTLLYLGVMLFATGAGILIYKNIGDLGHILSIIALSILSVICFSYAFRYGQPYQHQQVKSPTPYFDYLLLLGALLFVSVLTYLQFQYKLFDDGMGATTMITAIFFFYCAYRFDHLGILSLGISALASFFSISVSPQKWYSGEFFEESNLAVTAIIFGTLLWSAAMILDKRNVKKHFTFTYINFSSLIFLTGALAAMFDEDATSGYYFLVLLAGCAVCVWFANNRKSFLFLLYAFVAGYIGTTYMLAITVLDDASLWFFYLLFSCGGFIFFIIKYRNYFKRTA